MVKLCSVCESIVYQRKMDSKSMKELGFSTEQIAAKRVMDSPAIEELLSDPNVAKQEKLQEDAKIQIEKMKRRQKWKTKQRPIIPRNVENYEDFPIPRILKNQTEWEYTDQVIFYWIQDRKKKRIKARKDYNRSFEDRKNLGNSENVRNLIAHYEKMS